MRHVQDRQTEESKISYLNDRNVLQRDIAYGSS